LAAVVMLPRIIHVLCVIEVFTISAALPLMFQAVHHHGTAIQFCAEIANPRLQTFSFHLAEVTVTAKQATLC
jgi:hypothetical protein